MNCILNLCNDNVPNLSDKFYTEYWRIGNYNNKAVPPMCVIQVTKTAVDVFF